MITVKEVTLLIKQSLPDAQIDVKDLGGGDHLEVNVVSEKFLLRVIPSVNFQEFLWGVIKLVL